MFGLMTKTITFRIIVSDETILGHIQKTKHSEKNDVYRTRYTACAEKMSSM